MGVDAVQNFKYMCSGLLCRACDLFSLSSSFFLWFLICVLFLSLIFNF